MERTCFAELPVMVVVDQREIAPGRQRSLLRSNDRDTGEARFFVAEWDRFVACGRDWHRAAEVFAGGPLPPR